MNSFSKRALISVSNKTGLKELATGLVAAGYEIVSSGGTASFLSDTGLKVTKVDQVTGFPEILDGRVKTLNPHIHGGILARLDLASHREQLKQHGIQPFSVVVVNLYPFAETIAKPDIQVADAIEQIDIGGPTLVRASAKNFQHVAILTDPNDYSPFLDQIAQGGPDLSLRLHLARKAFQHTFEYDQRIAAYFEQVQNEGDHLKAQTESALPQRLRLSSGLGSALRYGENPHQTAYFYPDPQTEPFKQLQGKELSFNNLVDMESAWRCVLDFDQPAAVIIKHTNPCGVAMGQNLSEAFLRARKVDPVSSFGGVIAVNRCLDGQTAQQICEQFVELVIAPEFSAEALDVLSAKKNVRVMQLDPQNAQPRFDIKTLASGLLVQTPDIQRVPYAEWKCVSNRKPSTQEQDALKMAWRIVVHVKSNAIVYADHQGALGIGAGQMSRVDSAKIALWKASEAGLSVQGCAMASDAFFPFRDSVDAAAEAGVRAIVQPGGSIRDNEVIAAADAHDMVLFFTGQRHFKH
ncbi:MAG: bifunctional phosphoribosylaminoimidazolecarboxamide formyltransferase/IMP cyclohydrolase [Acidobacteria bacterium]|nr:bifunctional phosphoribosylaminoimidazolecarboxamide formyltransferase/IMP cyclohydrolase [Acidobacteriota bacterium]